ncbi:small basic family protein [Staphylococcus capitis]|uniref:small basic family protein n=1 Tax=Staphylococcus capitis TaxID=29388 RepID=UPI003D00C3B0
MKAHPAGGSGATATLRRAFGESEPVGFGCRRFDKSRAVRSGDLFQPLGRWPMIAVLALLAGVVLGVYLDPTVPAALQPYRPIAVVAALDAVFGGVRAKLDRIFDDKQFVVSFISNVLVAGLIVYLGDQLGVGGQLSTGVVVVLGVRIFGNVAAIRRHLFRA